MSRIVYVLSGPNLGRLGTRQPEIYGSQTLADIEAELERDAADLGVELRCAQTDDEAELIGLLHQAADAGAGVVLNPAAFTHYSYALRDAAAIVTTSGLPLVEIHLSNPHAREVFRHLSTVAPIATGVIAGFGSDSYRYGLRAVAERLLTDGNG